MGYVYWRWLLATSTMMGEPHNAGTLSRLHRVNPDDTGVTWCGALALPSAKYGIFGVYYAEKRVPDIEPCKECVELRKPMKVNRGRSMDDGDPGDENDAG